MTGRPGPFEIQNRAAIAFAMWDDGSWQIASDEPLTDETWPGWSDPNPMPRFKFWRLAGLRQG
jgi:hypothetical protein